MHKTVDEKLYHVWDRQWADAGHQNRITVLGRLMFRSKIRILKRLVTDLSPRSIIEVGCGLGHTMSTYKHLDLNYIGIDVSPHAIAMCREKGLNAVQKKLEDVVESYDLVSSDGMLEHFLNFEHYAKHLMRISSRYVLLIQPNHGSFWGRTLVYLSELLKPDRNVYEYNYRIQDFISVFDMNGFLPVDNIPLFGDVFRILVFQKKQAAVGSLKVICNDL